MKKYLAILFLFVSVYVNGQSSFGSASFSLLDVELELYDINSTRARAIYGLKDLGGAISTNHKVYFNAGFPPTTEIYNSDTKNSDITGRTIREFNSLTPGTSYSCKVCYTNVVGETCQTITFTTPSTGSSPTVVTSSATSVDSESATLNGNVTNDGGLTVTARGFYYWIVSTSKTQVTSGSGTGTFNQSVSGLTPGTQYSYQAYATNSVGTSYGDIVTFSTTNPTIPPIVSTTTAFNITTTSANSGGTVNYNGGSLITERGVCYSTTAGVDTTDNCVTSGIGDGTFGLTLSGLTANTTYYYRAYAVNSSGAGYGTEYSFVTTTTGQVPTVSLQYATLLYGTDFYATTAITSDGGSSITDKGIIIDTSSPTHPDDAISYGSGSATWTQVVSGLTAGETYYYRMYATNSTGTGYTSEGEINVPECINPTVTELSVNSVSTTAIGIRTSVTSDRDVLSRRLYYSTSNPATESDSYIELEATTGLLTTTVSGLTSGTTYYFACYAYNECGSHYLNNASATTTVSGTIPTVVTDSATILDPFTIQMYGEVVSDGGGTILQTGFVWGYYRDGVSTPEYGDPKTNFVFSGDIGAIPFDAVSDWFDCGTSIYLRAFAMNEYGFGYGNIINKVTPVLSLSSITYFYNVAGIIVTNELTAMQACAYANQYGTGGSIGYAVREYGLEVGKYIVNAFSSTKFCTIFRKSVWGVVVDDSGDYNVIHISNGLIDRFYYYE